MSYWWGVIIGFLGGVVLGLLVAVSEFRPNTISCPPIIVPACPKCPACPAVDQESLSSCMGRLTILLDQNATIQNDKESCYLQVARCNSDVEYWKGKYINYPCGDASSY